MRRPILLTTLLAVLLLALAPAGAAAQRITLQNSGLDEYTEDVPETGDGGTVDDEGGGNGGSTDDASASGDTSTSSTDPTATASGTPSTTPGGDAPTEVEVTSGSGRARDGELAATGLETLLLALAGSGLLALGFYIRKATAT